jgi:small-conductance mechanosensitive channel
MTIRRIWLALGRQAVFWAVAGALLVSTAAVDKPARAESSEPPSLETIKSSLDAVESAVDSEDATAETLASFRQTLNIAADTLRAKIDEELQPRVSEMEQRLKQLGPAPAKDAPPENPDVANEREELTKQFSEMDGELKQAKVLSLRVDQLGERVAQKRHSLYAQELFARSPSVLNPFFWHDTLQAFPIELRTESAVLHTWISERGDRPHWTAGVLIMVGIFALAIGLTRWWFPRHLSQSTDTRSGKAWAALWVFVWFTLRMPLAAAASLLAFDAFGLLTVRVEQIAEGLVAGIAAASFGYGVARGLFAPREPERRLLQEDDATALCFHNHLVWSARARRPDRLAGDAQDLVRAADHHGGYECGLRGDHGRVLDASRHQAGANQEGSRRGARRRSLGSPFGPADVGADRAGARRRLCGPCRIRRFARRCGGRSARGALSPAGCHSDAVCHDR